MKILLLGANGQLGHELSQLLSKAGELKACTRQQVDFTDFDSIRRAIIEYQPDVIVNAAAYTAVDKAESESELAYQVNAEAVAVLADLAKQLDCWLIHYSTDYVFDGRKSEPYLETDTPNPINVYGASKLAGEEAIQRSGCQYSIFRVSWVIGLQGNNFAKTILRLIQQRDSLQIIDDQAGVPTTTPLIAKVTKRVIDNIALGDWTSGIYHLTPQGETTWYGIAKRIVKISEEQGLSLSMDKKQLHSITTADYPTAAKRPLNSKMNTQKLESMLDFDLPYWDDELIKEVKNIIQELQAS